MDMPFTLAEHDAALCSVKTSSSFGPDGVTYSALVHLGLRARTQPFQIYDNIWAFEAVPDTWKTGGVLPILKTGKSPLELTSFRPIVLVSL